MGCCLNAAVFLLTLGGPDFGQYEVRPSPWVDRTPKARSHLWRWSFSQELVRAVLRAPGGRCPDVPAHVCRVRVRLSSCRSGTTRTTPVRAPVPMSGVMESDERAGRRGFAAEGWAAEGGSRRWNVAATWPRWRRWLVATAREQGTRPRMVWLAPREAELAPEEGGSWSRWAGSYRRMTSSRRRRWLAPEEEWPGVCSGGVNRGSGKGGVCAWGV